MKKILKLCLMTTVLASCGCIDAMATTDTTHTVKGAALEAGDAVSKAGAVMTVNSGHIVKNDVTFGTPWEYAENVAIDVMAGSCSATNTGSGKIQAGALIGSGSIKGLVVRHHGGGALDWEPQGDKYVIAPTGLKTHGFISDALTLVKKSDQEPYNALYEVIDSPENRLCRLYRNITANENGSTMAEGDKLTSLNKASLSNLIHPGSSTPLAPTTEVTIGSTKYTAYGNGGGRNKPGEIIYNGSGEGYKSVIANKEFVINLTADTVAISDSSTDSYSIEANLQNADGSSATSSAEDITSFTVITKDKTLSFTGENNFAGYDAGKSTAQKKLIDLNIGDTSNAGKVTFGGSSNSAAAAMNGIGNVTVTNGSSVLTLTKPGTDTFTTAGDWTFNGKSTLDSKIPMVIKAGTTCEFGK